MHVISYIHPVRTYLPCTGVGRHINNILLELSERESVQLELLFSQRWLEEDGLLNQRSPLRCLPAITFSQRENPLERTWKLFGSPKVDKYIPQGTDWLYAPMSTYVPVDTCPLAITVHDVAAFEPDLPWSNTWEHRWFRYKWSWWFRHALDKCRVVFADTEFTKQRMVELLRADADKIVVAGSGVDLAFFAVREPSDNEHLPQLEAPYVLVIGGLRMRKGAGHVLAVAAALQRRHSRVRIVVAGNSEEEYRTLAQQYPKMTLLGVVTDEAIRYLLQHALALLFLSPYEGFGLPIIEAMACGAPALVANCASLPEIAGDAGIVVPIDASEYVADVLHNLEHNGGLRQEYMARGLAQAQNFTWAKCADRVLDALERFN